MTNSDSPSVNRAPSAGSLWELFFTFLKIGFLTFGGGLAMVGVLRHEFVVRKKWIDEQEFLHMVSLATAVPGAIAVNLAFIIGRRYRKISGVAAGVLGVLIPSYATILILVMFFAGYLDNRRVSAFFTGSAAAVASLITYSAYVFGKPLFPDKYSLLVTAVSLLFLFVLNLHPVIIIFGSLVLRYLLPDSGTVRNDREVGR